MPRLNTLRKTSDNISADIPDIKMPFPPNMSAKEFLRNRPLSRSYFKSPNSFFIYRQQFVKFLKSENYNDQMIKVSKWASISWSREPSHVKQHYKEIEKEIQKLLNEQFKNEKKNPCQTICPEFIFEYPITENNNKDNDDDDINKINNNNIPYDDTNTDFQIDDHPIDSIVADKGFVADFNLDYSAICPESFFNNFYTSPFTTTTTSPASSASPTFSNCQPSHFDFENSSDDITLIDNNNSLESIFKVYDNMENHYDDYPFFSDNI